MAELKTRIVLRNDTAAKWTEINPTLKAGEFGIENDTNKFKIGNGTSAWNDLPYGAQSDVEVDATMVEFTQDITATYEFGKYKPSNGSVVIPANGKTVQEFFMEALAEEKDPEVTQPSASVNCPQAKAYEVGTKVTPSFTVSLNAGNYEFGPATGVTATSYSVTDTNSSPAISSNTGSFAELTVTDSMNYKINATVGHSAGANPKTNIGTEKPELAIKEGSKTASSGAITGFRAYFYGSNTTGEAINDSAKIRATTNKGAIGAKNKENYAIAEGTKIVVIAVPATYKVTSVLDTGAFGTDIFASGFKQSTVAVEGVGGYEATNYNVYTYKPDAALGANTYQITIVKA